MLTFTDCPHQFILSIRYLVSINRKHGAEEAMDNVQLAMKYKEKTAGLVVGVDLSGDPLVRNNITI